MVYEKMLLEAEQQGPLRLDKARHIKYWTRCLKTLLPSLYTSNDSNRMYLAYFILSAVDLLGVLFTLTKPDERAGYVDWIYHCQNPRGGFRMWPGTDFGDRADDENARWDPANVPATYFALASLLILGDDLKRVRRKETLRWIRTMQRFDGSFGETLVNGRIEGGQDPRFGYCAAGVRYILRGSQQGPLNVEGETVEDISVDKLVHCIHLSESFDGGLADAPFHEPHAGYAFCSLGCLAFIDRLQAVAHPTSTHNSDNVVRGPQSPQNVLRWLTQLQTTWTDPEGAATDELQAPPPPTPIRPSDAKQRQKSDPAASASLHQSPDESTLWSGDMETAPQSTDEHELPNAGFCGRTNKPADTCYAFWVSASLHILLAASSPQQALYARTPTRRYLLDLTQHAVMGGFTKFPGDRYADLYHSFLGLAALSLCSSDQERQEDGIGKLDAGMCVGAEVRERLGEIWGRWGVGLTKLEA